MRNSLINFHASKICSSIGGYFLVFSNKKFRVQIFSLPIIKLTKKKLIINFHNDKTRHAIILVKKSHNGSKIKIFRTK